jgi:hypothetical protein
MLDALYDEAKAFADKVEKGEATLSNKQITIPAP